MFNIVAATEKDDFAFSMERLLREKDRETRNLERRIIWNEIELKRYIYN